MTHLNSKLLKLMDPVDRKKLGRTGWTPEECAQKQDARDELEMHRQFISYLTRMNLRETTIYVSQKKKSPLIPGWPDFSIFGPVPQVLFLEFKTETGVISQDQYKILNALRDWGHSVYVPRSYAAAVEITNKHFGLA